ncbi:hypothetical protein [Chondromyces apiculatus]|uniref:HEAT repeat domain-containing protein n=1 Tax=Chondromyces apiculatus DSM 436 TaxID=1192034 RepID=A0A017THE2_9BACT|nr:hypothetical protein [Chondromyces apiculatus]EYF08337.1 Hypothetical protein CAP_6098 [Chondromyces apiculatus DSM 436]
MTSPRTKSSPAAGLKSERLEAALARALDGDVDELIDQLTRASGMPGPRPNLDLARAMGQAIARAGGRGVELLKVLAAQEKREYLQMVVAHGYATRAAEGKADASELLQRLAEDPHKQIRDGVVDALRALLEARGEAVIGPLAAWTDGYLQASVVLAALGEREVLARLPGNAASEVLARLDESFDLADKSPRAAERLQGVRQLREGMPRQIALFASRFPETIGWLEQRAANTERPESRQVIDEALTALRKETFPQAEVDRLAKILVGSAPPERYAARIVQGTRKRSKGRR